MSKIIDMWAPVLPEKSTLAYIKEHFPLQMLGYLRIFHHQDVDENSIAKFIDGMGGGLELDKIVKMLDHAGIEKTLITGFDELTSAGKTFVPNHFVSMAYKNYPDKFIPFAGIDIFTGIKGVRELERLVKEENFQGLSLRPFMIGLPADDRRYYPYYTKCIELDIPVSIHASANWTEMRSSNLGHPQAFDNVACDLPELKLIMSHAGYPWVLESCLLARKHRNLYLELAAHRPKYLPQPGTGWEPLFRFGNSIIQDKILFGTGSFLLGRMPGDIVNEFKELPVKAEVMEQWLHLNARKVMNI